MSEINQQFALILKQAKHSLTGPRQLVFETLRIHGPLTMNELVNLCLNEVDRATVYRVVKLLEDLDVVLRVQIGWKYKLELSESFSAHHHHINCLACSKTIDVEPRESLENEINALARSYNFELKSHQIEISGLCSDCQSKDPRKGSPDL